MRILLGSLLVCTLAGCVSFSENKEAAELHLKIGQGHLSSGNYPQALAEMISAEKLDPSNPIIQNSLGLSYATRDRLDLAEVHLRRAVELKSNYSEARNNLGRILTERGKYAEAATELQKVLADLTYASPDRAYTNLGIVKFKTSEFELAKKYLQKSLDLQRENCLAQSYYGRCFYELQDYRRSAETLDKAVGYCQRVQYDEPHYYSALSYYQLGQSQKAEARMEELIKLYPDGKYVEKAKTALETMRK
jgi:Tfp pilus assembly protein PilF